MNRTGLRSLGNVQPREKLIRQYGMDLYRRDPRFQGDIVLIEPAEYDYQFFGMNPLSFWERQQAAQKRYESGSPSKESSRFSRGS